MQSSDGQAPVEPHGFPSDQYDLSICVATFNRRSLLQRLLSSSLNGLGCVESAESIEWVIVDDGSSDDTVSLIDEWRDRVMIQYVQQANLGRAQALKRAVLLASGRYTVIMDSDDYFTEGGLGAILRNIRRLGAAPVIQGRPLVGALFGTVIISNAAPPGRRVNLPATEARTNFVAARADFRCQGDLKEVVETHALREAFRKADFDVRRVPTYLWWAHVSLYGDCQMIREVVAIKEYMPDGMTANIFRLKTDNSLPMAKLYELLSRAGLYRSVLYHMRSKLLWYRYALLSGTTSDLPLADRILYSPVWLIYLSDRLRMARLQKRRAAS